MATVIDKIVVDKRGKQSKFSGPVYVVKLIERPKNELDKFFEPRDQVKLLESYRR